jgi:hypothetical protein
LILVCGPVAAAEPVLRPTPEQFARLHTLIKPQAGEDKWAAIPWLTSLWQARQQAAAEGKPILLWEMDGHPLGCT